MEKRRGNAGRELSDPQAFRPTDARGVAFAVLNRYWETGEFVAPLLDRACTAARLSPLDRGLAGELALGVVLRRLTLDALIDPCVSRPRERVEAELWTLLQMGAYQLAILSSIPPHAAVNETVETAVRFGKRRWRGMVNGVLRSIGRALTDEFVDSAAADAFPLADARFRKITQPAFPDPAVDFPAYLSRAFSFPTWLIDRWVGRYDEDEVQRLACWFNAPGRQFLRVNPLRGDREGALQKLEAAGIDAAAGLLPESIRLEDRVRPAALDGLSGGEVTVQDESAMWAVDLLGPQSGETVLDLCAAPGTKTAHMAERMKNEGRIAACDVNADRLTRVEENCQRLGITIVEPVLIDREGKRTPAGPFDAVLVDAPCTNTGVLGKRPEARWRLSPGDVEELAALQGRLLRTACERVKPGGRVVYSTCSIEPEEGRAVVESVMEEPGGLQLLDERSHVPGLQADGGYQALMRRD